MKIWLEVINYMVLQPYPIFEMRIWQFSSINISILRNVECMLKTQKKKLKLLLRKCSNLGSKVQGFKNRQVNIKYNNMITITKGWGVGEGEKKTNYILLQVFPTQYHFLPMKKVCLMFETPLEPLGRGKMGVLLCQQFYGLLLFA